MIACLEKVTKQRESGAGYSLLVRSFSIRAGEHVAITGPSGCGKSTTLDLLGMVLRPDSAERFVFSPGRESLDIALFWDEERNDRLTDTRRKHMGYVLQTGELFPFLTVEENVVLTAIVAGVPRAAAQARAGELMDRLEITRLRRSKPDTLSIGQRQRAAIARALAPAPCLLLADEPTAALDPGLSRKVMKLLLEAVKDCRAAVVMVSHDVALVRDFAFREVPIAVRGEGDRVMAVLDDRQGEP